MNKIDRDKWAIRNDRDDIVPVSMVQGYIQTGFFYKCLLKDVSNDLDNFGLLHQPVRMALATRVQISNLPPLLVPAIAGEYIRARISYVADPERLFVQLENNAWIILKIGERLRNLAKQRHEPLCNPECGTIVAALYPLDRCYYRAAVFSKTSMDAVVVIYIDYGNMASVNINDAFLLKDAYLLSIPPQAIQLIIGNGKKPRLTSEQIKSLLTDQTVGAQINDVSRNGESFIANLFVKDEKNRNINLTEVILGERPAPTLPLPKPVTIDSFLDMEDKLMDYMDKSSSRGSNGNKDFESCNFSGDSSRNHSENEWTRTCKGNYETAGLRKQNRDGKGSLSNNFRSKTDHHFNDYSDGSAPRIGDRRTCRNSNERGHTVFYRGNSFHGNKRGNGSGSQRFVDNGSFAGSFNSSDNGIRDNSASGGCFGRSKGRGGRLHLSERKDQSPRSFLDRDTGNDDIAADKNGWKSDNLKTSAGIDTAKSELDCVSSNGFEKKVNTENWIVNEGGWGLNNTDFQPVDNMNQIETSERISENATTTSACSDFDDYTKSIESSENLSRNTFGVPLKPHLEVDSEKTSEIKTAMKPIGPNNVQLSSITFSRIESSSLEEIKFGDTVDGIRSDRLTKSDPLSFFVQLDRDGNNIEHLVLSDAQLPVNLPKLSSFEISQACIALFMGNYYRAEIIGDKNNNKKRVLFVDYGNVEDIDTSELYFINNSLPEQFYTSRRMAFQCRLHGVMPVASKNAFDPEARKIFSELTTDQKLFIRFLQQSVKGIYEVTIMLSNGRSVSDILISRGFAVPFKWGIGPVLPLYETLDVLRSDELDHVHSIFTVQLSDSLVQLEQLNNGYVNTKKMVEVPRIGDVVISYFDESPYRAEIIAVEVEDSNTAYRVRYVDYGNESLCMKEELFVLDRDEQPDEILYTPRQGIRCRIDGIRPLNHEEKWPEEVQKCIDNLLAPSASFEAIFGSPSKDGVYPIKVSCLLEKEDILGHVPVMVLKNQFIEEDNFGMDEANNANNKIELVSWLSAKGYAKAQDIWRKYPVKNLLFDGKHEYAMLITEVDGQIIRARPYAFTEQYNKMKKALANIELIPLGTDATTGLITLNKENKRAMLISSANNASSKKCLLVDEGISIEEIPVQFYGSKELSQPEHFVLVECHKIEQFVCYKDSKMAKPSGVVIGNFIKACDLDSFLVRTCHRLSVQCRFTKFVLDEESRQMILSSAASGPAKVILTEYIEACFYDSYLINDIFFSDRTTLMEKLKKAKQEKIDDKESVLGFVAADLEQTSGRNSNQGEKVEDLRLPTVEMKQIECSQNLVINEDSYLKPQVSEITVFISDDMEEESKTFDPEIITFMDSLVASVSKLDRD